MAGRLQAEIRQSRPFPTLREEALANLWRTAALLEEPLHQLFKSLGISFTQYHVLRILRGAGKDGLPTGEIGGRMIARDPDITRLMDRLEGAGLAKRSRGLGDRRVILTRITPKGLKLLDRLDHPVEELISRILGHMPEPQLRLLIGLLEEARGVNR
jgi:DNA-binding MarR family transcriptional regulator